ncbi:MAG: CoA-binding protein [Planctomycetales bacterium]
MDEQQQIEQFLAGGPHAVVGASLDRSKYGNKVLRVYMQNDLAVLPVNPRAAEVEGLAAYADLTSLPAPVHGISIITPPGVTETVIEEAGKLGIKNVWMQPGAESEPAVARAEQFGMNVIAGGPCLLVVLKYHEAI